MSWPPIKTGEKTLTVASQSSVLLAIVRRLLPAGVDVEAQTESQKTSLHCCAFRSRGTGAMRELILEHNANLFAVDEDGKTPFDYACSGRIDNGRFLLQ